MAVRVGINGFGRIGRCVYRVGYNNPDFNIVAINDITDPKTLAHLLRYDSVHGRFNAKVDLTEAGFKVDGKEVKILAKKDPSELPWKELGVDVVLESTGLFTSRDKAELHFKAGAKKVIISAPAKNPDITLAYGINHKEYDPKNHHIISNASCTTNCLAPMAKVIDENFGLKRGTMTTIHSYTNDQRILDLPHKDLRRARAAALSMIITTTGAAKAVGSVLPHLKGKLDGVSVRVPTPNVSLVDLVAEVEKPATIEKVNGAFEKASQTSLKGILAYEKEELVSSDFNGTSYSCIFDALSTMLIGENFVKIFGWYDNEWGFSHRMIDVTSLIAKSL
ncbi:MAG: type I glyceraldehyde-3-phosphate dehydrogenase [Deltaproteobacteria bacterium]|nr:type I glyceraldehyde-3-phosphate dehydrogenase [Deltaproteobacteria bacterium]